VTIRRIGALALVVAGSSVGGPLALATPANAAAPCPPDIRLELEGVPRFVPWGGRATISVYESDEALGWGALFLYADGRVGGRASVRTQRRLLRHTL
jgi:hypothetical protein